ncbi:hypothetical protein PHLGIDRAFT_313774 [Phlebiopsis gigantea 11061_1 CR5-6]|uniref:Uncharacterized protein n=1 Tax=Phlebiopsis gigantea (strain 11061_1 CR5-6) TaxID=745531 RepID=A0A0C3PB00_PHLG1|nr:hypothetical protein PHLGIDRAFT_313774 [Phlebiopsis gigantea 11061_1 CR5-6]
MTRIIHSGGNEPCEIVVNGCGELCCPGHRCLTPIRLHVVVPQRSSDVQQSHILLSGAWEWPHSPLTFIGILDFDHDLLLSGKLNCPTVMEKLWPDVTSSPLKWNKSLPKMTIAEMRSFLPPGPDDFSSSDEEISSPEQPLRMRCRTKGLARQSQNRDRPREEVPPPPLPQIEEPKKVRIIDRPIRILSPLPEDEVERSKKTVASQKSHPAPQEGVYDDHTRPGQENDNPIAEHEDPLVMFPSPSVFKAPNILAERPQKRKYLYAGPDAVARKRQRRELQ